MPGRSVLILWGLLQGAAAANPVPARPPGPPLTVANGQNSVDFTGDGVPDLVMRSRRANYNAHDFEVVSFHVRDPESGEWTLVPLFEGHRERPTVTVSGGADCVLHDFRLYPGMLVLADRAPGENYADAATVTVRTFALRHNAAHEIGWPLYRFEQVQAVDAVGTHCDVGAVLDAPPERPRGG